MTPRLERLSELLGLPPNVVLVIAGIYVALVIGSIARLTHLHALPEDRARSLLIRLRTWWIIAVILTLVILLKRPAVVIFMGLVSVFAIREYLSLIPAREADRRVVVWVYASIPLQYVWIYLGWYRMFIIFIPVLVFLWLTMRIVLRREPAGFLHMAGTLHWGVMILVFCFSHVAYLLALPTDPNPAGGSIGWFLYLVFLTEFNDIAQALWGRPLGRHKLLPSVSPAKSWEGLVGGVASTAILAVLLAPLLTPLAGTPPRLVEIGAAGSWWFSPWAMVAGLIIGLGGFFGDLTMSAVKRDCHVKDSGALLPGQGGVLDRIDSLTFTAPVFFHYIHFLYY